MEPFTKSLRLISIRTGIVKFLFEEAEDPIEFLSVTAEKHYKSWVCSVRQLHFCLPGEVWREQLLCLRW